MLTKDPCSTTLSLKDPIIFEVLGGTYTSLWAPPGCEPFESKNWAVSVGQSGDFERPCMSMDVID